MIVIQGAPRTKKNSQRIIKIGGHYSIIPSKAYKEYEKSAGSQIKAKEAIDYPINVKVLYYMPTRRRVDLVNLLEATLDILVRYNVISDDNSKVVVSMDGSRVLYDKENPRAEIYLEAI